MGVPQPGEKRGKIPQFREIGIDAILSRGNEGGGTAKREVDVARPFSGESSGPWARANACLRRPLEHEPDTPNG